jgi:hypothetical protein
VHMHFFFFLFLGFLCTSDQIISSLEAYLRFHTFFFFFFFYAGCSEDRGRDLKEEECS